MRTTLITSVLVLLIVAVSTVQANAQEEKEVYLRGGFSDMTGFVAVEHIQEHIGFSLGWHKYSSSLTDKSKNSIDLGMNYYLNDGDVKKDSWYVGLGYATKNAVQTVNGEVDKWGGTFNVVGGYRFAWNNFDVKRGGGYLFSSIKNGPAIDLSAGFAF